MIDKDNITLPREVVEGALEALDSEHPDIQLRAAIALRTHLAAEQPKQEPVAWMDRFGSVVLGKGPYETFTTPLYTFPPDAPTVKESLTVQSRLDAESFREERDEARALLNGVLQDIEALRRDAEQPKPEPVVWWDVNKPLDYLTRCENGTTFHNRVIMPRHAVAWAYTNSPEDEALRRDAEQPKHDLMKWAKDAGSSPEDLERFATYTIATRDMEIATLREENEALRRDAEQGRWLREWLDNNGLLVRAIRGESLVGYEHPDIEALRRDAEKWRKAQAKYIAWQKGGKAEAMEGT